MSTTKSQKTLYSDIHTTIKNTIYKLKILRRAARGRLAEILVQDLVPLDKFFRTISAGKSFEDIAVAYSQSSLRELMDIGEAMRGFSKLTRHSSRSTSLIRVKFRISLCVVNSRLDRIHLV